MTKRYFLDTEFLDDGDNQRLVLISIALVCSDGRELYLVSNEFDYDEVKRDDWMRDNVLAQLPPRPHHPDMSGPWRTRAEIRDAIAAFIEDPGDGSKPEIWAYFASYDWVLFCQLFGKMINLPKHFPWLVNDLKVWATHMGYTGKFKELLPDTGHHDALCDARWNRDVHALLLQKFDAVRTLPSPEEVKRGLETLRDISMAMNAHPPPPEKFEEIQNLVRCMTCLTGLVVGTKN